MIKKALPTLFLLSLIFGTGVSSFAAIKEAIKLKHNLEQYRNTQFYFEPSTFWEI